MGRVHVPVAVQPLAYRRAEAAAALGISTEVFDAQVRAHLPVLRIGGVVAYPVKALEEWVRANQEAPMADQLRRAA